MQKRERSEHPCGTRGTRGTRGTPERAPHTPEQRARTKHMLCQLGNHNSLMKHLPVKPDQHKPNQKPHQYPVEGHTSCQKHGSTCRSCHCDTFSKVRLALSQSHDASMISACYMQGVHDRCATEEGALKLDNFYSSVPKD